MDTERNSQAQITVADTFLVALSELADEGAIKDFCGTRVSIDSHGSALPSFSNARVYLCGDIGKAKQFDLEGAVQVFVVRELSHSYDEHPDAPWPLVDLGQVPILVHGAGVYYRRFFDPSIDCFSQISKEHTFQSLTESTKPGTAHRKGIYLTPVEPDGEDLHFRLLRCSTNLSGPTENFRATDAYIVSALNQEADRIFQNSAPLNHVLAQIYRNTSATDTQKQHKAKISAHADKTKDMPENGIMAFCTFYDQLDKLSALENDRFDYGHKTASGLTKLVFKLKKSVADKPIADGLPDQFAITLYPNSAFFMPLSTNQLYTHQIRPSMLNAEMLPTRMGYVVRCSATEAVHSNGKTFLKRGENRTALEAPTSESMASLRTLYAEQNKTESFIDYGDRFRFSMNQGDYLAPGYEMSDEFRSYSLPMEDNLFEQLRTSVRFENVGKGRQGAILVKPDTLRGVPIVRTTTKYSIPAQCFSLVHMRLAQQITTIASLQSGFNNALIENYTEVYKKMGTHSDQALDLEENSHIALFSCYEHPELETPLRKLIVESKEDGRTFEIPLLHNSVIVFSLATNRRFKHKIVLDTSTSGPENTWIGITYRTSKTFVRTLDGRACFENGIPLTLATEQQASDFFRLRGGENKETDFIYPAISFTLSESDLATPSEPRQIASALLKGAGL